MIQNPKIHFLESLWEEMTHAGMSSVPEKRLIRQLVAVGDFHSNCIIIPGEIVSLQKQLSSFSPGSTNLKGHPVIGVGVGEGGHAW